MLFYSKVKNLHLHLRDKSYLDKLAYVQVIINCRYSFAQRCTWEDTHACLLRHAILDENMSQHELITHCCLPVNEWLSQKNYSLFTNQFLFSLILSIWFWHFYQLSKEKYNLEITEVQFKNYSGNLQSTSLNNAQI